MQKINRTNVIGRKLHDFLAPNSWNRDSRYHFSSSKWDNLWSGATFI